METEYADTEFHSFLTGRGIAVGEADAITTTVAMIDWYAAARADDTLPLDQDGDMLALRWGTHDWGHGSWFEYDITRQLTVAEGERKTIWQLSVTFRYEPSELTQLLRTGMRWCSSPANVKEFRQFVTGALPSAFAKVATASHVDVRLDSFGGGPVRASTLATADAGS